MDKNTQLNQLNLREIISAIFRRKKIIFLTVPIIIIGTYVALLLQTPVYEATVKMHIVGKAQVAVDFYSEFQSRGLHQTQMAIVQSNTVLKRAVTALKLDKRPLDYEKNFCHPLKYYLIDYHIKQLKDEINELTPENQREQYLIYAINNLKENLKTELIPGTDLFTITIKDFNPEEAKAIANVVSRSYIIFDQQQQLAELSQKYGIHHPSVQQLRDNIYAVTEKLSGEELPELEAIGTASVKIIEQAISNNEPIGKPKIQILLIAIIVSLGIAIGLAVVYDIFIDQTFKSPTEIVKFTGLPLLGSIPIKKHKDDILINSDKFNPSKSERLYSNFFEDLADQLLIYLKVNKFKTVLITSAFPKGGTSTTCANIGISLAQKMGIKTLIIDANFRHPVTHTLFNLEYSAGFANILEEGKLIEYHEYLSSISDKSDESTKTQTLEPEKSEVEQKSQQKKLKKSEPIEMLHHIDSKLSILQAGKASMAPVNLLNDTAKLDAIFKVTKVNFDVIIIDCTNLKNFRDTGMLSAHVDGVVLLVNDGKEKRQIVLNSINYIKQKKGNLIGLILNRRRFPIPAIIYKRI